jgi:hypothetical protein
MFKTKTLFFAAAVTLFSNAAAQSWEVMVYEGSNSCGDSGGTTLSGSETGDCRVVGLGNIAGSFAVILENGQPGAEFVCKWLETRTIRRSTLLASTFNLFLSQK